MSETIDQIIAEAKSKEVKPFGLTYDEGLALTGLIQFAAGVLSHQHFALILLAAPDLVESVRMLQVTDPDVELAVQLSDRLMKFCEEHAP